MSAAAILDPLNQLRSILLRLPEVSERLSHGAPCFYISTRRPLCYFHDEDFDQRGRPYLMCPALAGVPEDLASVDPDRFFRPTPSASGTFSDWIGVYLDTDDPKDWVEVAAILHDAFRTAAPKRLVATMGDPGES